MQPSARRTFACLFATTMLASAALKAAEQVLPGPLTDMDFRYDAVEDAELVELGRMLFFDPILSGNRNIACGTCHHPAMGTGDGLPLGIGEGGVGSGKARRTADGVTGRVPRNAQPLYNIGAREYVAMFHDGRLEGGRNGGIHRSPARERLPEGLDNLLEAQALFPVTSAVEMAGQRGENLIATAAADHDLRSAWRLVAARLRGLPGYRPLFSAAFDEIRQGGQISYVHAAKALAAFQSVGFRSDESPFDAALRSGDLHGYPERARRGADLFYGEAGCSACHSGPLLTDHRFHAIAMPQVGPGKSHGKDRSYWEATGFPMWIEDEGRFNVTRDPADRFAFRTPSLRNVALTGPWGHSGSYDTLEAVVRHHLDPIGALERFDPAGAGLPELETVIEARGRNARQSFRPLPEARRAGFDLRDGFVQKSDGLRGRIAAASTLAPKALTDADVAALTAFLETLTDPTAVDRSYLIPARVPSGLPVEPRKDAARHEDTAGL